MKKVKIIQIGIGHDHAHSTYVTVKNQSDIFDFVAIVVVEGEERFLQKFPDYLEGPQLMPLEEALAIDGLDAAIVETDDTNLTKYAQIAADHGLHVQMDKPGNINNADFERLARTLKHNGKVFHLGYMYRYNPAVKKLIREIKEGRLGDIFSVEAQMSCMHKPDKRPWLAQFPGGMLYYLGCHLVDMVLQIQGIPDEIIPLSVSSGLYESDCEDYGMAAFRYKKGTSFVKTSANELCGYVRRQLVVSGSRGTVELKPLEYYAPAVEGWDLPLYTGVSEVYEADAEGKGWSDCRTCYNTPPYDRYIDMIRSFAAMVKGEIENPYSYEYEVTLHRAILAACGVEADYKASVIL